MNINIYNPYVRNELYHHGILGQRWGKRNGPPYPLGAGDHSASEKKAGWRKSLNNDKSERKIQRLGKKYDNLVLKAEKGNPSKRLLRKMDNALEKYEEAVGQSQKRKGSTDHPKSEPSLEKELAFLSDTAKNGGFDRPERYDKHVEENINRYVEFQKKLVDNSIDWYNDDPHSERTKAWKKEKDAIYKKLDDTLGKESYDLERKFLDARSNDKKWDRTGTYSINTKKLYDAYKKARNEYDTQRDKVYWDYNEKLVDIVLKDLGIPVTEENRKRIWDSQVLFWD